MLASGVTVHPLGSDLFVDDKSEADTMLKNGQIAMVCFEPPAP